MKEARGDIWDYWDCGFVVIPTNLQVRRDGTAVMGAGLALQAARKVPGLDRLYGAHLRLGERLVMDCRAHRLLLLPTKYHWKDPSDLDLIEEGLQELVKWHNSWKNFQSTPPQVALPKLGCGLGGLKWEEVKPLCAKWLTSDDFIVVSP